MRPLNQSHFYTIKTFVEDFHTKYAKSPTVREIAIGTDIPYPTIQYYLNIMKNEGDIEYNGRRSIQTNATQKMIQGDTTLVGLVGSIACGELTFAEENIEEYFRLPVSLVGNGNFFCFVPEGTP